jgi:hypothetical protein
MRIYGTVRDASTEKPVEGGRVSLFVGDRELATLRTDEMGEFDHREAAEFIGETLRCSVEKEGYKPNEATYDIRSEEAELNIDLERKTLEKKEMPPIAPQPTGPSGSKWPKIAALIVIAGIVVGGLFLWWLTTPPSDRLPVVTKFELETSHINEGESATLAWETKHAETVEIRPDVGTVTGTGSRNVNPSSTTTYTLTATNAQGSDHSEVTLTVEASERPAEAPESYEVESLTPRSPATLSAGHDSVSVGLRYSLRQPATLNVIPLNAARQRIANVAWQARGGGQIWSGPVGSSINMPIAAGRSGTIELQFKAMQPARVRFLRLRRVRGSDVAGTDVPVNYRFVP